MAKVFGRSVLLVFCFHNYFFTAVLKCIQDFCSAVSRGRMEGMHTEGTENKLLTCRFFDYFMLPSVFPQSSCLFTVCCPFSAAASPSLLLLPSFLLFSVWFSFPLAFLPISSADLLIVPMPLSCFCHFSSFLPTDPTGQLTVADICEVTSFCSFGKKAVAVLHAQIQY